MTNADHSASPPHGKFDLGQLAATPRALALLQELGVNPLTLLHRHWTGDFGDLCAEDRAANERAITDGFRVLSAYDLGDPRHSGGDRRIWIITEADRSCSTLLTPSEY